MKRSQLLQYQLITLNYQTSGWFDIQRNCNGFTVTNVGTSVVQVNDQIFFPGVPGVSLGDSRSYGGNEGEICVSKLKVAFAAGGVNNIEVVQKVYTNIIDD